MTKIYGSVRTSNLFKAKNIERIKTCRLQNGISIGKAENMWLLITKRKQVHVQMSSVPEMYSKKSISPDDEFIWSGSKFKSKHAVFHVGLFLGMAKLDPPRTNASKVNVSYTWEIISRTEMDIDTCVKTGNHTIEHTLLQTHLCKYINILV